LASEPTPAGVASIYATTPLSEEQELLVNGMPNNHWIPLTTTDDDVPDFGPVDVKPGASNLTQMSDANFQMEKRKFPTLLNNYGNLPLVTDDNHRAIAHDVYMAFYGRYTTAGRASSMSVNSLNKSDLFTLYTYLKQYYPTLPPMIQYQPNVESIDRKWIVPNAVAGRKKFTLQILRDMHDYYQFARTSIQVPGKFFYLSQYPFDKATWTELAADFTSLYTIAKRKGWISPTDRTFEVDES
jgi:hypothetical protein